MADESGETEYINEVAQDTLHSFKTIAQLATEKLAATAVSSTDVFAYNNSWTSGSQERNLDAISLENMHSYENLTVQPAIARIVVEEENAVPAVYYICRESPVTGFPNLASYRAPFGRVASLPIGTKLTLRNRTFTVLERALLSPSLGKFGWDASCREVESGNLGPLTIESLRAVLEAATEALDADGILEQLLADEIAAANVFRGRRRSLLIKMGLRDQPVLDHYQDEIFRLPLSKQLIILGPPGTGKTTTLIRRLGQKLNVEFLEESEKSLISTEEGFHEVPHAKSWLMFTPTELLKDYLKEAFARESVPASNRCITTWSDYRRKLAREELGILKTATGKGSLIVKDALQSLQKTALENPIAWFEEFNDWQHSVYLRDLREAAETLAKGSVAESTALGRRLVTVFDHTDDVTMATIFRALVAEAQHALDFAVRAKEGSDKLIKDGLKEPLKHNRNLLEDLADFINEIQQTQGTDSEEQDESEEEEAAAPQTTRAVALNAYMQAVRSRARAAAVGQTLSRNSKAGRILGWFDESMLATLDFHEIGKILMAQGNARRFANPVKSYFDGVPKRYRAFRRISREQGRWYREDSSPLQNPTIYLT